MSLIPPWPWPARLHGHGDDTDNDQHYFAKGRPGEVLSEKQDAERNREARPQIAATGRGKGTERAHQTESGVRSTRIYCRPVWPVDPARSENVTFYPTAAAAERAGFRPCLRCRPEATLGSPAWAGTATTVARAMRMIDKGYLNRRSVAELAAALGVGPRHLLRLFLRHTGAMPSEIAATKRVQKAKCLIDETTMPLAEVAFAAGFCSVRRFK